MKPLHIETPLLESQFLKNTWGKSVYFKLELLQPSGSFKLRGIGRLCQQYHEQGTRSFVASSGGNAGAAVAYCGMMLKVPTTVFIPKTSHPIYIDTIESYGATVVVAGAVWDEAHLAAQDFAQKYQSAYIPPFDNPTLWAGHSTMIDEIVLQNPIPPDAVILSVGGGGLACGVLEGMHRHGWNDTPLIAVETAGADSFFQSVAANRLVTLPAITSRATSLGAKRVTERLLKWSKEHVIKTIVVSDDDAEDATRAFAHDKRMLVELASGASLAPIYHHHPLLESYRSLLVIVCGGINISHFNLAL